MKKAFTLIELIVVIAIIAVLAAVVAPQAFKTIEKGKTSAVVGDYKSIKTATMACYADTGNWAADADGEADGGDLAFNQSSWTNWDGPYLDKWPGQNGWGGTYTIYYNNAAGALPASFDQNAAAYEVYLCTTNVPNTGSGGPADKIDVQLDGTAGAGAGDCRYSGTPATLCIIIARP